MIRIREASPADRPEWLRMLGGLYPDTSEADHAPWVDAFLAGRATGELLPAAVFVCEAPGGLIGFLELSIRPYAEGCTGPTPFVESWYVEGSARRRGVGRALMRAAEDWARTRGYAEMGSDTELENHLSQRAHAAIGFQVVERLVAFRKAL